MRKTTAALAATLVIALASCKNEEKTESTTVESGSTTDTTVVVHENADTQPPVEVEDDADGTSVSIGNDGVKVDSKKGDNKTQVDVDGNNAEVELKR